MLFFIPSLQKLSLHFIFRAHLSLDLDELHFKCSVTACYYCLGQCRSRLWIQYKQWIKMLKISKTCYWYLKSTRKWFTSTYSRFTLCCGLNFIIWQHKLNRKQQYCLIHFDIKLHMNKLMKYGVTIAPSCGAVLLILVKPIFGKKGNILN